MSGWVGRVKTRRRRYGRKVPDYLHPSRGPEAYLRVLILSFLQVEKRRQFATAPRRLSPKAIAVMRTNAHARPTYRDRLRRRCDGEILRVACPPVAPDRLCQAVGRTAR